MDVMLVAAGGVTGLLVGLTGVGGGALMTPFLLLVLGVAPMAAVGTDLWFAAITKTCASRIHVHHDLVDWAVARYLWLGSLPAALATFGALSVFTIPDAAVETATTLIAFAVLLTACGILLQKPLHALGLRLRLTDTEHFKAWQTPLTIIAGGMLGVLVTLTSVGAGALGAVFLAYLYPLRLTPSRLIATDIAHAIPLALFAGLGHLYLGHVDGTLLGNLLLGSIPGVLCGALLSSQLPQGLLRVALGLVLLVVGIRLGWG